MTKIGFNFKKMKAIALFFGVLVILLLFSIFRDTSKLITRNQADSLDANNSIRKIVVDGDYLYLKTQNESFKVYKDAIDYPRFFAKYPIEINEKNTFYAWVAPIFILFGAILYIASRRQKMPSIFSSINKFSQDKNNTADESIRAISSSVRFKDVAGIKDVKEELEEIIDFLKLPQKYTDFDIRLPKGVLLVGPPGVGKTMIAKAVAGEAGVPFFYQSGASFVHMYVGMGAKRVSSLFQVAKQNAPSIIFIDEIDAIGKSRGGRQNDEREATLNQLLTEMDGFEESTGVIVMAATNKIDVLDEALLRAGRFDRRIFVSLPDMQERIHTLELYLSKKSHNVNISEIAKMSVGFNFASLATWVNEAAMHALKNRKRIIEFSDFEAVKDKVMVGKKRLLTLDENEREIQATYQGAKALVATWYDIGFEKIGIATERFEEFDYTILAKSKLINRIKVDLAGTIATQKKYKEIFTNSSKDIVHAKELAQKIVNDFDLMLEATEDINVKEQILQTAFEETGLLLDKLDNICSMISDYLLKYETITQEQAREMLREIF
ncbi:MAG: AAA family ATPase [Sulfurovaceae bacterium]|nr:AAA family ATPase [Sulfurovaceae bacterium]